MAGTTDDDEDIISSINVTPLVDVVLVLLIIFMVTTEVIHEAERPAVIPVDMPAAASAEQMLAKGLLDLVIDREGKLYLNGEAATPVQVGEAVAQIRSNQVTPQALISADKDVSHGEVAQLMDFLRQQQVFQVALNTKKQVIE